MEKVYIIKESIEYADEKNPDEVKIVGAALNEEEAKHKVKHAREHYVVCPAWEHRIRVTYSYEELPTSVTPSWLMDEK